MKTKNNPGETKSKSIKEVKDEINNILSKLEKNDVDLEASMEDYKRLIYLNRYVDKLFGKKGKEIAKEITSIAKKKRYKKI